MSGSVPETITIDGVEFCRKDSIKPKAKPGKRAVMVMDRGWVMAGDAEYRDGRVFLSRVVHIRRWEGCGFDGMVKDPSAAGVKKNLFPMPDCDLPATTELFKVPVGDDWGLAK